MWSGIDGVTLRLIADGIDTVYTVNANGAFTFPATLVEGTLYAASIISSPLKHTCLIISGANGVTGSTDARAIDVACNGPALQVHMSVPDPWTFDPTLEVQPPLAVSTLQQSVKVTIESTGEVTSAKVAGIDVPFGVASAPQALMLGTTLIDIDVSAKSGLSKTYQIAITRGARVIEQAVYGKSSNTGMDDNFGFSVALSGDTLAVGAYFESSGATGINQNQADNSVPNSGAVYVFQRTGSHWVQQAYIKASNTEFNDQFGWSVALSGDTLAVGALGEDSSATGINGDQTNNAAPGSGAVYMFQRTGTTWTQQAYVKASNTEANDGFGRSVALSGSTLAVGAYLEDSDATGVNHDQTSNAANNSGAVYIFQRAGSTWFQQAYLKASNTRAGAVFGSQVALDGDTLAVGSPGESSSSAGVDGNQADIGAPGAGAVYIFHRDGLGWTQQAYIKASNTEAGDAFGSVAISGDTLVVGAFLEASRATGVGGNQTDNGASQAGAVYVFTRTGTTWMQQAYIKASNTEAGDLFGTSVALSGDVLAVGAISEDSTAAGTGGDQSNNGAPDSGAVYVFQRSGSTWSQRAYIKASNSDGGDIFGVSVAVSADSLVVGAAGEGSSATGIVGNENQQDNIAPNAGAIYLFQ